MASGQIDSLLIDVHRNIGCVATETNKPDIAIYHLELSNNMAARKSEATPGDKVSEITYAISFNELGVAHMMSDDWQKAERCFLQAIRMIESVEASAKESKSLPVVNLGLAYWLMGARIEEADKILMTGLADREAKYGLNDRKSFM